MEHKKSIDVEIGFLYPNTDRISIYSKSGCSYCIKLKNFLKQNKIDYDLINCDDILIESKEEFLKTISELANREITSFPIVFKSNEYIGGFKEAKIFVENMFNNIEEIEKNKSDIEELKFNENF